MPKQENLNTILVLGAGPIMIGQACEFDYSGTQACKALREEGCRIILLNSNPATIMTDPSLADKTYIEPLTLEFATQIIARERPDAILPTMGGQTALNLALSLEKQGVLKEYGVRLIGADSKAIELAENRELFRQTMQSIGLDLPLSRKAANWDEALEAAKWMGFPIMIRPSFTLGGAGCGLAYNQDEFQSLCQIAFSAGPQQEILLDEALIGWKEFEMEVVRDRRDNCIVVCCIENFDPMGVHTGDSITVAPAQTLTDKEYQAMRNASFAVLRAVGVETGGSNVQFAVHPQSGRMVVIEMNPRVSRSSALASKATGFPIAKIAAKLALGYTLDELSNEITGNLIPASFEPALDYVVVKIPRFNFEKFPEALPILGPQMRSVGEAMAIGRTFQEALLKAMRSMEMRIPPHACTIEVAHPYRLWDIFETFRQNNTVPDVHAQSHIDPWFLEQIQDLVHEEQSFMLEPASLLSAKRKGFSDQTLAQLLHIPESKITQARQAWGIQPVYKRVDSCAAEFATPTAYLYSSYEEECEAHPTSARKILVLGSGPNRIGQGIEFDYCCVHAIAALKAEGFETIMVNSNPETVSTDFDCADRLYCSPLTLEDVLAIINTEKPEGVLVQFGGQTPLHLAEGLHKAGIPLLGLQLDQIAQTENRQLFQDFLHKLQLKQPPNCTLSSPAEAISAANTLGYPLIIRPSFVLGGRAMSIVHNTHQLDAAVQAALDASPGHAILVEKFLEDAIEVDIDAISDGHEVYIPAIMEHIEPAGIHSGDSACCLPPISISSALQTQLKAQTRLIALNLGVKGLINIQFAIKNQEIYVIEVNPRASRTIPFVSKCLNIDLVTLAVKCLLGHSLAPMDTLFTKFAIKEAVLPFQKFLHSDSLLGPEMKSTGEVMGTGQTFAEAFAKAQIAAGNPIPSQGFVYLNLDPQKLLSHLPTLQSLVNYQLLSTSQTSNLLLQQGINCLSLPDEEAQQWISQGKINLILALDPSQNTWRKLAIIHRVSHITTYRALQALATTLQVSDPFTINPLQP